MKDLKEGQVIHLDLVNLGAHIGQHVVLGGEADLILFILLEKVLYDLFLFGGFLLSLLDQVIFHQAVPDTSTIDLILVHIVRSLGTLSGVHVLNLLEQGLIISENLISKLVQGLRVVIVQVSVLLKEGF